MEFQELVGPDEGSLVDVLRIVSSKCRSYVST
jgi:hypothetical protein